MKADSIANGLVEAEPSNTIRFEGGLLGFPQSSTFSLVEVDNSPYLWMQSLEEPDVSFLATSPFAFFPEYELEIDDEDEQLLDLANVSEVEILTLITVHRHADDLTSVTANLMGPIVINTRNKLARQIVLDNSDYSTQEPLVG